MSDIPSNISYIDNLEAAVRSELSGTSTFSTSTLNRSHLLQPNIEQNVRSVRSEMSGFSTKNRVQSFQSAYIGDDVRSEYIGISENRPHGIQQYAENVRSNASSRLNDICLGAPMSIIDVPIEAEDKTPVLICQNIQANSLNDLPKRQVLISDSERDELLENALAKLDIKNKEVEELKKELELQKRSNKELQEKLEKKDRKIAEKDKELNEWRTAQNRGAMVRGLHVLMCISYFPRDLVRYLSNDKFFVRFRTWFGRICGKEAAKDLLAVVAKIDPPKNPKCQPRIPGFDAHLFVFVRTIPTSYHMVQHMDERDLDITVNGEDKTMNPRVFFSDKLKLVPKREDQKDRTKRVALPPLTELRNGKW